MTPPPEAADAFRDVASARADSSRIVNESQGYSNDMIPRSRGEAKQMKEAAQGLKQNKINVALATPRDSVRWPRNMRRRAR